MSYPLDSARILDFLDFLESLTDPQSDAKVGHAYALQQVRTYVKAMDPARPLSLPSTERVAS